MIEFIKKNKKILISSTIFTGINNNIYCGCKGISGKVDNNNNETPKNNQNPPKKDQNPKDETPNVDNLKNIKESLKNFLNSVIENNNKLEENDRVEINITPEIIDSKDDKNDLSLIENELNNINNQIIKKNTGKEKNKDKALQIFKDDFLQSLDEKYFTDESTHEFIKEYIDEGLKLKKKDEEINNLKKILAECKKNEEKIIKEMKNYSAISEFEKKIDTTTKHLYFIKKYQIRNINIKPIDLFSDIDNLYYIYKSCVNDCINNIDVLKDKYKKDLNFKTEFNKTIEKAKEDYNNIEDVIKEDDEIEKTYMISRPNKSSKDKVIIDFTNILNSYKIDQGSKSGYKHLFEMLLLESTYNKLSDDLPSELKKSLFNDDKLIIEKYENIKEEVRKEIESKGLIDKAKKYIKLLAYINENIKKLDNDNKSVKNLSSEKDRINEMMNQYKNNINNIIKS